MNIQNFKKYSFVLALGAGFALAPGLSSLSTVQAQNNSRRQNGREIERRGEQRRNDAYQGPVDSNGNIDRNRNGIDDRYETRDGRVDLNQDGIADSPVDSNGNIDRNRNGIDDRYETRDGRVDINQNGIADQEENGGRYGRDRGYDGNWRFGRDRGFDGNGRFGRDSGFDSNGRFGNGGYRNDSEFQKGYSDGARRGREDALTNRQMNPNNSSHYRSGSSSYRAGFERGFFEAYRRNGRHG